MLIEEQKQMLVAAAGAGFIKLIMFAAMELGDIDTCVYIHKHYMTTEHFTQQEIDTLNKFFANAEIVAIIAMHNAVNTAPVNTTAH